MSVLQEIKGLMKELYFPGGSPVSMQNFRSTVHMVHLFDISMACIVRTDNHHISRSKRVNKEIICLCTRSDENLFTCKISRSLELWLVRFVFSKENEESVKIMRKSAYMQNSSSLELWLVRFVFSKEEEEESVKIMFTCSLYFVLFSYKFLHAVTF